MLCPKLVRLKKIELSLILSKGAPRGAQRANWVYLVDSQKEPLGVIHIYFPYFAV